jgi:hypothetical protein
LLTPGAYFLTYQRECQKILAPLVDVLELKKSRILIYDFVDPPTSGIDHPLSLDLLDLQITSTLNTHTRSEEEWKKVIFKVSNKVRIHILGKKDGIILIQITLE